MKIIKKVEKLDQQTFLDNSKNGLTSFFEGSRLIEAQKNLQETLEKIKQNEYEKEVARKKKKFRDRGTNEPVETEEQKEQRRKNYLHDYHYRYVDPDRAKHFDTKCNNPECEKPVFFDDRYLHTTTGKKVCMEYLIDPNTKKVMKHASGVPKIQRHLCLNKNPTAYMSKDQANNAVPPNQEKIGHLITWYCEYGPSHCSVCRVNSFWFTNFFMKEHPELKLARSFKPNKMKELPNIYKKTEPIQDRGPEIFLEG